MNRQKREQQILDDAMQTFIRKGYKSTSVSDLVKEAQVSRGTFYLYFKSKEEIFDQLIDRLMSGFISYATLIDCNLIIANNLKLSNICHELAQSLTKYRFFARFVIINSTDFSDIHRTKINSYTQQIYQTIAYNINKTLKIDNDTTNQGTIIARCLIGSIKECLLAWSRNNEAFDIETQIYQLMHFIRQSLTTPQIKDNDEVSFSDHPEFPQNNLIVLSQRKKPNHHKQS